jgi:hypothetical protein
MAPRKPAGSFHWILAVCMALQAGACAGTLKVVYAADLANLVEDPISTVLETGERQSLFKGGLFHEANPDPQAKELGLAVKLMFDAVLSGDIEKIKRIYKPVPENQNLLQQLENPQMAEAYAQFAGTVKAYEPDFYIEGPSVPEEQKTTYYVFVRLTDLATEKERHQIFGFQKRPEGWLPVYLALNKDHVSLTNVVIGLQQGKASVTVVE